jgi:hypothetical protein
MRFAFPPYGLIFVPKYNLETSLKGEGERHE